MGLCASVCKRRTDQNFTDREPDVPDVTLLEPSNNLQPQGTSQKVPEITWVSEDDLQQQQTSKEVRKITWASEDDLQQQQTSKEVRKITWVSEDDLQQQQTSQTVSKIIWVSEDDLQQQQTSQKVPTLTWVSDVPKLTWVSEDDLQQEQTSQEVPELSWVSEDNLQQQQTSQEVPEEFTLKSEDDKLLKVLKEDLITHYREQESDIPAAPLVEEHKVALEKLYVLPPLLAYDVPYMFGPGIDMQTKQQMSQRHKITFSKLFCDQHRFRKIYISANAGFGKTSLSQKITMTWCQSHLPLTSLKSKYSYENLSAMKYFDLLFLLHLRDYQCDPHCNLDDLIMKLLSANMSRKSQYTNEFIEKMLHEKKCLIILDGLDEWAHPGDCLRKPEVPHNNHPGTCTVLTTTRDWKLGTIGLSPKDIDRRVEISMLNDRTRNQLQTNAMGILNEKKLNLARKTIADFDKEVQKVQIGDIINIPYILLQLMCLFFGGLPIGNSKCEIYSNITEFTLERGLNKKDLPDINVQSNDNTPVLNCMKENETCKSYFFPLMKLGKLAFLLHLAKKKNRLWCLIEDMSPST